MSEDLIPLITFFIGFFVAFSIIELFIIFALNRLSKKYWEFVIDELIRLKVHHGKLIQVMALIGIIAVLAFIWFLTPLSQVIGTATPILKTFSIILFVVMVVIYFMTTRKMTKMALEKRVHQYIYFVISIIIFAFVVIMMDQSYNSYQNYIQTQFVETAAQNIQATLDEQEEQRLIAQFKKDYLAGRCEEINYTEELTTGLTHFVYIKTDLELASAQTVPVEEDMPYLKGQKCTDGENTFLLNEEGKWYWVIAE
jgi:hypothetical protein